MQIKILVQYRAGGGWGFICTSVRLRVQVHIINISFLYQQTLNAKDTKKSETWTGREKKKLTPQVHPKFHSQCFPLQVACNTT
jgi:hypothetical protein